MINFFECNLFPVQTLGQQLLQDVSHAHLLSASPGPQSQRQEVGTEEEMTYTL